VLADIEEPALAQTATEMKAGGADVLAVVTDVSQEKDVAALARQTMDTYGAVTSMYLSFVRVGSIPKLWILIAIVHRIW